MDPAEQNKTLYALGLSIGKSLGVFGLTPAELEQVKKGLTDQVTGKKPTVELETYGPKIQELARSRASVKTDAEKKTSQAFLEKSAKEPGAQKTASGLIYKELKPGTGESPKPTDTVTVQYRGTLINGTEFDSSYKRPEPATFALNQVIPCWTEGVQRMKVGGKSRLVCPSEIAYGDRGAPPTIPGGAALIFEVELLNVKAGQQPGGMPGGQSGGQSGGMSGGQGQQK
jgi:FKBP-type peptidyl-prolyl cis-trans isomerase FkpA